MDLSIAHILETEVPRTWLRPARKQLRLSAYILAKAVLVIDAALLMGALGLLCWAQQWDPRFSPGELLLAGGGASLLVCSVLSRCGAYRLDRLSGKLPWLGLVLGAVCVGALLFAFSLELLPTTLANRLPGIGIRVGVWAGGALILLAGARGMLAYCISATRLGDALRRRVALIGVNEFGRAFIERVAGDADSRIEIVGLYDDRWANPSAAPAEQCVEGNLQDLATRCYRGDIDIIVLAVSMLDTVRIDRIRHALRHATADIFVAADIVGLRFDVGDLQAIGQSPVVSLRKRPLDDWQQLQKAIFDRLLAGMLLLLLSPALLLIAFIIRLDTPGAILFRQPRMGFNNRVFMVYKFRTMIEDGDPASLYGDRQAKRSDPRITRVGKWLRNYSVDELPQLLNVLKGEMSLVGPRPHPLNTRVGDRLFQDVVDNYAARHRVLPGITGWAQVNGWRGETVVPEQIEQRVAHDLHYIENWSMSLDIRILLLTLTREIVSKKAF